jgi:transposase
MRIAPPITLTDEQRTTLEAWSRGRRIPVRLQQRARIVLLAAQDKRNTQVAEQVGVDVTTAGRWRSRFTQHGLAGIEKDRPRGGRKPTTRAAVTAKIVELTTQQTPANATHWSTRTMAQAAGASQSMVSRVWRAHGLKPHLVRTFKLSNDPQFIEKLHDVAGLYLNPPEHALVLSVDEKSQVQALDRTQPSLPMKKGRCGTMTHDYKRHGTTTLFAALQVAGEEAGKVIGTCMARHRHQEWIKFLKLIDQQTPAELDLHLIIDNYATHKHPKVQRWLKRHRRFHVHFIPTSCSWLNLIERWFRRITDDRIRRGAFRSVPQLIETITGYIETNNADPKPLIWTATAENMLAKVSRARAVLDNGRTA